MTHPGLQTIAGTPIPLHGVTIAGEVYGGYAQIRVIQRYRNTEPQPVEAVYTFPLPADATLMGFSMECNGRRLVGIVKEREEAFRQYDDAIVEGHGAALLEQERPNVFTASVGNLLPGEETLIEVQYAQRVHADEGVLRCMIPTLVAPRYIPGTSKGDRTSDGWAEPTDRVPDADRITPRIGPVTYGLTLDILFDFGEAIAVESPSHHLRVIPEEGHRMRVFCATPHVALDRDIILTARGIGTGPLTAIALHRSAAASTNEELGVLVLTVVPDLTMGRVQETPQEIVFLIDVSGSMAGKSMNEAQAALRLCLRHLRAGARFNIIAFQSSYTSFAPTSVLFTQATLEQADRWVQALQATGGTELLAPFCEAISQVPNGVVVLLTDGQVGNENEILTQALAIRQHTRVYSFGIGTNVSDTLLRDLAKRTGGAVEFIYPGERIDEKVVAQFARALALRVTDVQLSFSGVDLHVESQAPAELPPLVDGEPWVIFTRFSGHGRGQAEIRGRCGNESFVLQVPVDLSAATVRPVLAKFWAAERIRDWEAANVRGRRAERMQERITALAVQYGIMSPYTAFLVIEERMRERQANGVPTTRVVPVNLPAGWAMFKRQAIRAEAVSFCMALPSEEAEYSLSSLDFAHSLPPQRHSRPMVSASMKTPNDTQSHDTVVAVLNCQLASGLWDAPRSNDNEHVRQARITAEVLLELLRAGVTTTHALHGGQVKKAVQALITLAGEIAADNPQVAELALGVAWLVTTGRRTRAEIEALVSADQTFAALKPLFRDEQTVRAHVEQLAA